MFSMKKYHRCVLVVILVFCAPIFLGSMNQKLFSVGEGEKSTTPKDYNADPVSIEQIEDQMVDRSSVSASGSGSLLSVIEYSEGQYNPRTARANESNTFYPETYDLPTGWTTTQITASSSEMYHLQDWVTNGQFSTISGWNKYEVDPKNVLSEEYEDEMIRITRKSGGNIGYDHWGSWNQTVNIDEGGTASAHLNVTFRITTSTGQNGQNAMPYVYVNGSLYELPTEGNRFSSNQDWKEYSLELDPTDYTFPGDLDIAFGIRGFADTQFQTDGVLYCDDVSLTLRTSQKPEAVNLRVRDNNNISNVVPFTFGEDGKGHATLDGSWNDEITLEFLANESGTEFTLDLFAPITRLTELDSNTYSIASETNVSWDSDFFVGEMGDPFIYRHFNVSMPDDWTPVEVLDGFDIVQLNDSTEYNASYDETTSVLSCDVAGTGESGTPHYGQWEISSTSPNYGSTISFWKGENDGWYEASTYYPDSRMRINTSFSDSLGNPPATEGNASLSFYDSENSLIYAEADESLDVDGICTFQNGTDNSNITVLPSWLPGSIVVSASWSNGTAVGEIESQFTINHHTTIEVESAVYQTYRGDPVSVRIRFVDLETGLGISGGTAYYNWTFGSGSMGYAGNGWYAGSLDTSLASIGTYDITTNVTKEYYDFVETTSISVEVQERTHLIVHLGDRRERVDYDIAWGNSKQIALSYDDEVAMKPSQLTANPGLPNDPEEDAAYSSNNDYVNISSEGAEISLTGETNITDYGLSASDMVSLTYKVEGHYNTSGVSGLVEVYNYSSANWMSIITDYSSTEDVTKTWRTLSASQFVSPLGLVRIRINATHTTDFQYNLDFLGFVAARPIDNTAPEVAVEIDWAEQTGGSLVGPEYNSTLGFWQVTLNTRGVEPGEYTMNVLCSATGHQTQSKELSVTVRAHHTGVSTFPSRETPWGNSTEFNLTIQDLDNASQIIDQSNFSRIELTSSYGVEIFTSENWTYNTGSEAAFIVFTLDTNAWNVGTYAITIDVYTEGDGASKFFEDGSVDVDFTVRAHDTMATVYHPDESPWGWKTNVSLTLKDLDHPNNQIGPGNISQISVGSQTFGASDWIFSDGVFTVTVDTRSWAIGSGVYDVSIVTTSGPKLYADASGEITITIRSHLLQLSVRTPQPTPWGMNTTIVMEITDLDNSSLVVSESNLSSVEIGNQTFTSSSWTYEQKEGYAQLTVIYDTTSWPIQDQVRENVQLYSAGSGSTKYYDDADSDVFLSIRRHNLLVTAQTQEVNTPWGSNTTVLVYLSDLDNSNQVISESNISYLLIGSENFTASKWTYSVVDTQARLVVDLYTENWMVDSSSLNVSLVTTDSNDTKFYTDDETTVNITIRAHKTQLTFSPVSPRGWGKNTTVDVTITDLDNESNVVPLAQIDFLTVNGTTYTSSDFSYDAGTFSLTLYTADKSIGKYLFVFEVSFVDPIKNYTDSSTTGSVSIVSHSISVEAIRPASTPWSDNTSVRIRIFDISDSSTIISSDNVTKIVIDGQEITTWAYDNGNFTVIVDTDDWNVGLFSKQVEVLTSGSGQTKFFNDGEASLTIEIRRRYTEAYAPAPDPVPYRDNLTFEITFRDRDLDGLEVNFSSLYLNDTQYENGTDFWVTWLSEGHYRVKMNTSNLDIGDYTIVAMCVRDGYENATTTVRFTVRYIETNVLASGYNFNVPLDTNLTFTLQFKDVDHDINVENATIAHNWTEGVEISDDDNDGIYDIKLLTFDNTTLGTYTVEFNVTRQNYESGSVEITVKIEAHSTYLTFDEPVTDTGYGVNITAAMFYQDLSLSKGITNDTGQVQVDVENEYNTSAIWYVEPNTDLGDGHYKVLIPADQFGGTGQYNFTVYFNWTGSLKYQNLTESFTVEITGTDTDLTVAVSPQAVYYGDLINFTLLYKIAETGEGIINDTGDVWGRAEMLTSGQPVTSSDFNITEVDRNEFPGHYRILLNSSRLTTCGEMGIRLWMNWSKNVNPLYQNQTLDITVTILVRTTLVDVTPPQNTAYDEIAEFSFAYYDSPTNTKIENSTELYVQLNNLGVDYNKSYSSSTRKWTITVDTASLGSTGTFSLELNITWTGPPFYQNQTKSVSLKITERPTQLTYTAPVPTFYNSNVTFSLTYTDLIDDTSIGMDGNNISITNPNLTLSGNYTVVDNGDGTYTVELNTTAFLEPGSYQLTATATYLGSRYESDASTTFTFKVKYRSLVLTSDPAGSTPYEEDIELTIHITDGETTDIVRNSTSGLHIGLAGENASNPDLGEPTAYWDENLNAYRFILPNSLEVGTHALFINVTYDYIIPYYGSSELQVSITISRHSTELQLYSAPESTGYGLNATFELKYLDLSTGETITNASLVVVNGSLTGSWMITDNGEGIYTVEVNTSALDSIGNVWVKIETQNSGELGNYKNATIYTKIYVRHRYTLLTYDPISSVGYTDNVTVILQYADSDNDGAAIDNTTYEGAITLTTNSSEYYVSPSATPGEYILEMPASQFTPFVVTDIEINMTFSGAPFFQNQSISVGFEVRGTQTEFSWDPLDPVPFGNQANLTFYWGDSDSGDPVDVVLGDNATATVVSLDQVGLNTSDSAIIDIVQGADTGTYATFFLLLNTTYLDACGTYRFEITLNWTYPDQEPYYQDQIDRRVSIHVRVRDTAISQIKADPVPYGDNLTLFLQYVDLDNESQLVTGAPLNITVLGGYTYSVNYTPTAEDFYTVEIMTKETDMLGVNSIDLEVIWSGTPFYENQTDVSVSVTIEYRIANMDIDFPLPVSYLEDVNFSFVLQDSHSLEYINNNASYISVEILLPEGASGTPTVEYLSGTDGQYGVSFNTSSLGSVGSYKVRVVFNHTTTGPYYSLVSRNVTGTVDERTTTLDYSSVPGVAYGNFMTFNLTYLDIDSDPADPISSAELYLSCATSAEDLVQDSNFWFTYLGDGDYLLNISTEALGEPNKYYLEVKLNSTSEWWLSDGSRSIQVRVEHRNVELSIEPPQSVYYADKVSFTVTLIDLDNGTDGTGLENMQQNLSVTFTQPEDVDDSAISIVDMGSGNYNVSFDTGILGELSDYGLDIRFIYPNTPYYWANTTTRSITGRVLQRPTQMIYEVQGRTPYLNNVTITFYFEGVENSTGVPGVNFTLISTDANESLVKQINYWVEDHGAGDYTARIDSTALGNIGKFSVDVSAEYYGEPFYANRSKSLTVQVRERATRLTYVVPPETPYSDDMTVELEYTDVDAGLTGITDAESYFSLDAVNGTPVDSSYYSISSTSEGQYELRVNTSKLETIGHYILTISVSGMTESHYQNQTVLIDSDVRARNTQLTTAPIAQTSYSDNATVTFYFEDRDSEEPVTNTTEEGIRITTNISVPWWIEETEPGKFVMSINVTALNATGQFTFQASFNWVLGAPFYSNRSLDFDVSVTGANAILTYTPPAHTPHGDNITIEFEYRDSVNDKGISNESGNVFISFTTLNETTGQELVYTLDYPDAGVYSFTINSSQFDYVGDVYFEIDVVWNETAIPYYPAINDTGIRATVRNVYTQVTTDAPDPGIVPVGDNVSIRVAYLDLDHDLMISNASIETSWTYGWSYKELSDGSLNVTLETDGVPSVGKYQIQFTLNKSFYAIKDTTVSITIRFISTSASATPPEPGIVPVGDNVTLELSYRDTDHEINVTQANLSTDWDYGWNWTHGSTGGFLVTLFTENVNTLSYEVTFTATKDLHSDAGAKVKFRVREIRTSMSIDSDTSGVAGQNVSVIVEYEDIDHDILVVGAEIYTNPSTPEAIFSPTGDGKYNVTFLLWESPYGTYTYDISADAEDYSGASLTVDIDLKQVITRLEPESTAVTLNWSDPFHLAVWYQQEYPEVPVENATVTATLKGEVFNLDFDGTTYNGTINTSFVDIGTHTVTVNANKTNYESRMLQITLVLSVLETDLCTADEQYSYSISSGEPVNLTVHYCVDTNDTGIEDATISYLWDYGEGVLTATETPGVYTTTINTTGAEVNVYTLYVRANKSNHAQASLYLSLDVKLVETNLIPIGEATVRAVYGEEVHLNLNFTDEKSGVPVSNANTRFRFGDANYNGTLTETEPGIYEGSFDSSLFRAGSFSIYVVASKPGYETGTAIILAEISPIQSVLSPLNTTLTIVHQQSATFWFNFSDQYYNRSIENATLEFRWISGRGNAEQIGNGLYSLALDSNDVGPGVYDVLVSASKSNYITRTTSVTLEVSKIPTEVIVADLYEIPVGDSYTISAFYNDTYYDEPVSTAVGSFTWSFGVIALNSTEEGNYSVAIPDNIPLGTYSAQIELSKTNYTTATARVTVIVRRIKTELSPSDPYIQTIVGETIQFSVDFLDIDHDLPISDAQIVVEQAELLIKEEDYTITEGDEKGTYIIEFVVPVDYSFDITIRASKGNNYESQEVTITVVATPQTQDPLMTALTLGGSASIILLLIGALLYVKVFSVPKMIRWLNGMIKDVSRGKVPDAPEVSRRDEMLQNMINESLSVYNIQKPIDEVPEETIISEAPEIEDLLDELAEITGLTEEDVDAFRQDLFRMKPSERPGFVMEVITQEKARRAEEISEKKDEEEKKETVTKQELADIRERLEKLGIAEDEIDLIMENAEGLTKAEIDVLLDGMD
ncbi:MAG: hypothetical protein R6V83_00045 [Candidatus Thorarchaeota archaeon]